MADEGGEAEGPPGLQLNLQILGVTGVPPFYHPKDLYLEFGGLLAKPNAEDPKVLDPICSDSLESLSQSVQFNGSHILALTLPLNRDEATAANAANLGKNKIELLDRLCGEPVTVALRNEDFVIGQSSFTLDNLIHNENEEAGLRKAPLTWTHTFLEHLYSGNSNETPADGGDDGAKVNLKKQRSSQMFQGVYSLESPPASGELTIDLRVAEFIGRSYAKEDFLDWSKMTLCLHGVYNVPEKLLVAGAADPASVTAAEPQGRFLEDHSLSYHLRFLGCDFDGGRIYKPPREEEEVPEPVEDESEAAPPPPAEEGEEVPDPPALETLKEVKVTQFLERLTIAGYADLTLDADAISSFMTNNEQRDTIMLADFTRLQGADPACGITGMLQFRTWLLSKYSTLEEAFTNLSGGGNLLLGPLDAFNEKMTELEYPVDGDASNPKLNSVYAALDKYKNDEVTSLTFSSLHVYEAFSLLLGKIANFQRWFQEQYATFEEAFYELKKSPGEVIASMDEWSAGLAAVGFEDKDVAELGFRVIDCDGGGYISKTKFTQFEKQDFSNRILETVANFVTTLTKAERTVDFDLIWERFGGSSEFLKYKDFKNSCRQMSANSSQFAAANIDVRTVYLVLMLSSDLESGTLIAKATAEAEALGGDVEGDAAPVEIGKPVSSVVRHSQFVSLAGFNFDAARGAVARFKRFLTSKFGDCEGGFKSLFCQDILNPVKVEEGESEFDQAESILPSITWASGSGDMQTASLSTSVSVYKGRAWLQSFFNTIGDARGRSGRNILNNGAWLYFFPKVLADPLPLTADFGSSSDGAGAKLARWHHAGAYVDLTPFRDGLELTARCFLSRLPQCPIDCTGEDFSADIFEKSRTYVKFTIQFTNLRKLFPRNGGSDLNLFAVNPHPAIILKSPEEIFHDSVVEALAMLGREYADLSVEAMQKRLQPTGPVGQCSKYPILGPLGWKDVLARVISVAVDESVHAEGLELIEGSSCVIQNGQNAVEEPENERWTALVETLKPPIQHLVRSRVIQYGRDNIPCSGLYGDERDARYTDLATELSSLICHAINKELKKYQWRRDARLWKNANLLKRVGEGSCEDESHYEPEVQKEESMRDDDLLSRLVFESEISGDYPRAIKLFEKRLKLPQNQLNYEVWRSYARFLMRCQQRQEPAEKALIYAISIKKRMTATDTDSLLFLMLMYLNRLRPCSLDEGKRLEAAISLATEMLERHPKHHAVNFFFFLLYAVEQHFSRKESDNALALKYLTLSRMPDKFFSKLLQPSESSLLDESTYVLGDPSFRDLWHRERLQRGEDVPSNSFANFKRGASTDGNDAGTADGSLTNAAGSEDRTDGWLPTYESVHALPSPQDEKILDIFDKIIEFGVPYFVRHLLTKGVERFPTFLTMQTQMSERCRLQLIRSHMLLDEWKEARQECSNLLKKCDRICDAHILLGECEFRLAAVTKNDLRYTLALKSYDVALHFLENNEEGGATSSSAGQKRKETTTTIETLKGVNNCDPALFLRTGAIFFKQRDYHRALEMYTRSLQHGPTAEAWRCAGVTHFYLGLEARKMAQNDTEAMHWYRAEMALTEANLLDKTRPKIWAWLAIVAAEVGKVNLAKQAVSQAISTDRLSTDVLEFDTAVELIERLLAYSVNIEHPVLARHIKFPDHNVFTGEPTKDATNVVEYQKAHDKTIQSSNIDRKYTKGGQYCDQVILMCTTMLHRAEIYEQKAELAADPVDHIPSQKGHYRGDENPLALGVGEELNANIPLTYTQEGQLHFLLGRCYQLSEEWKKAYLEYKLCVAYFYNRDDFLQKIHAVAMECAAHIRDEYNVRAYIDEDIRAAMEKMRAEDLEDAFAFG